MSVWVVYQCFVESMSLLFLGRELRAIERPCNHWNWMTSSDTLEWYFIADFNVLFVKHFDKVRRKTWAAVRMASIISLNYSECRIPSKINWLLSMAASPPEFSAKHCQMPNESNESTTMRQRSGQWCPMMSNNVLRCASVLYWVVYSLSTTHCSVMSINELERDGERSPSLFALFADLFYI